MIKELSIYNYKSLRDVTLRPGALNIMMGANASGKTNFVDCLDFISDIYRDGLERAVAKKGGYHNICFRRHRRSKSGIKVKIVYEPVVSILENKQVNSIQIETEFEIGVGDESISADFSVKNEKMHVRERNKQGKWVSLFLVERESTSRNPSCLISEREETHEFWKSLKDFSENIPMAPYELIVPIITGRLRHFTGDAFYLRKFWLERMRVYHLTPANCKQPSSPLPNAQMGFSGDSLASTVDYLQKDKKTRKILEKVLEKLQIAVPSIKNVKTRRTVGATHILEFMEQMSELDEKEVPWDAYQVSDGTIMIFSMLLALLDDRSSIVAIDEPENSVHPWIIKTFMDTCRELSQRKQIFLTTHSPVLIDETEYEEIYLVDRTNGETIIWKAEDRFPEFGGQKKRFGELWLSGMIGAVPGQQELVFS